MITVVLLTISNIFMTIAWYGHLKYKHKALWIVILTSWAIAFVEYCFQVPANRIGHSRGLCGAELKTLQEVITLIVFCGFSLVYLKGAVALELPCRLRPHRRRRLLRLQEMVAPRPPATRPWPGVAASFALAALLGLAASGTHEPPGVLPRACPN
jgi:Uncharacterized protein conserved in bacteria